MKRASVRRTLRRIFDKENPHREVEIRHHWLHLRHIFFLIAAPFLTVPIALNCLGLGRLRNPQPKPPVKRYERERLGDLIHIGVNMLVHFREIGDRIKCQRQYKAAPWATLTTGPQTDIGIHGYMKLAYVEMFYGEQQCRLSTF